jgi:hypothetical protein
MAERERQMVNVNVDTGRVVEPVPFRQDHFASGPARSP